MKYRRQSLMESTPTTKSSSLLSYFGGSVGKERVLLTAEADDALLREETSMRSMTTNIDVG